MSHRTPVGILLAAGSGQRFDPSGARNKLLSPLANGTPVAVQAAQNLLLVLERVIVVVRNPAMAEHFQFAGCHPLIFTDADLGMGATLAYAVSHVASQLDLDAVLIALADMPYVQRATIARIITALDAGSNIVQPFYGQQGGHPVGFGKIHFSALMALHGDRGARHLLQELALTRLTVDDPGILQDIDYPSDLEAKLQTNDSI